MMKNIKLSFRGYWRSDRHEYVPHFTGVYLVYRCVYNPASDTVSLNDLIYIGKSNDVGTRVGEHCNEDRFTGALSNGETLCFSVAEVSAEDLDLVENALIFAQKPDLNTELKDVYNYPNASFDIEGRCSMLRYTSFTIKNP